MFGKREIRECEFKGYVKNPWEFLRDGDLLIIPSNNEGDGLVLVEAVLNRVPLIAINIPDLLRFNLHSDNYFNDIQNLTSQILKFRDELSRFVVNQDVARRILEPREPVLIAKQWCTKLEKLGAKRVYWIIISEQVKQIHIHLYPRWSDEEIKGIDLFALRESDPQPAWNEDLNLLLSEWAEKNLVEII
jgi:hypothetical protein